MTCCTVAFGKKGGAGERCPVCKSSLVVRRLAGRAKQQWTRRAARNHVRSLSGPRAVKRRAAAVARAAKALAAKEKA